MKSFIENNEPIISNPSPDETALFERYKNALVRLRYLQLIYENFPTKQNRFNVDDATDYLVGIENQLRATDYLSGLDNQWFVARG